MRFTIVLLFLYLFFAFSGRLEASEIIKKFPQKVAKIYTKNDGLPEEPVSKIFLNTENQITAVTKRAAYKYENQKWSKIESIISEKEKILNYQDLPADIETILSTGELKETRVVGAENGLYLYHPNTKKWKRLLPSDKNYSWALRQVSVVNYDSLNRLWFGAEQGIGFLENDRWYLFTGKEGLPFNQFTCSAAGKNGEMWFGTKKGVILNRKNEFHYFFSRRWLPDDYVNDLILDTNGSAWIATNKGVSQISFLPMNLEEKAAYFTEQVETRHNRTGFIADCALKEQFNIDSWIPKISDNDGMYTAMYGAAQAFRYAVTGDKQAKELANRSFKACKWLVDITHEPGFPARVIIPVDWPEAVNEQYGKQYNLQKREGDPFWKLITPRFVKSKDGKYLWKCDTSSDELAGHYFFYGIYYDLVAETVEEKRAVQQVVRDITDHLIRNDFFLRDHDGKPTRWGNFSPEFINSVWGWEQRGLNSMMMLSFLNVAEHVSGDSKYAKIAGILREKHQYHINSMQSKIYFPPENVVPWDNNLCLMSMYGLLNYENDPELLLMYRLSLEHAWQHISRQKNAFWNIIYGALINHFNNTAASGIFNLEKIFPEAGPYAKFTAEQLATTEFRWEDVLETLKRMPLDLIGYTMDNTHRLDIIFDPTPGQVATTGWHVSGGALAIDERGHVRQDRDGFALYASEDNGFAEHEGTFYLLPYYMARYHNLLK